MGTHFLIQDEGLDRKHRGTIQRAGDDRTDISSMKFNSRIISDNRGLIIVWMLGYSILLKKPNICVIDKNFFSHRIIFSEHHFVMEEIMLNIIITKYSLMLLIGSDRIAQFISVWSHR